MEVRFLPLPPTKTSVAQAAKTPRVPQLALRSNVVRLHTPLLMVKAKVPARLRLREEKSSRKKASKALRGKGVVLPPANLAEAVPERMRFHFSVQEQVENIEST